MPSTTSSTKPTTMSIYESLNLPTTNEFEFSTYPSFLNYSSSSSSSTSGSSTAPSPRSLSHSRDNYIYQRQISTSSLFNEQKFNQSISTRMHAGSNDTNSKDLFS